MNIGPQLISILISGIVLFGGLVFTNVLGRNRVELDQRISVSAEDSAIAEALKEIEIEESVLKNENELSWADMKKRELVQSGTGITFPIYIVILVISMLAIFLLVYKIVGIVLLAIPFAFLGTIVPKKIVDAKLQKNIEAFNDQLVKALRRMSSVMRSGGSLKQALSDVSKAKSMPTVIRIEFRKVLTDTEYGLSIEEALFKLYERTGSSDVKLLAIAVEIQRQLGGNIAQIFDTIGTTISNRKLMDGDVKATLAQAKATSSILSAMPIVLGGALYLVSPDFFDPLTATLGGKIFILTMVSMIVFGIFVMKQQVNSIKI